MKAITIIVVDDHKLLRDTWCFILNSDKRFQVIDDYESGEEAVIKVPYLDPDIVIMDINLTGISGIEATEQILQTGCSSKILGVSLHSDPGYAFKMFEKGAMGYLTKNSSKEEMFSALMEIQNGKKFICEEIKMMLTKQPDSLYLA